MKAIFYKTKIYVVILLITCKLLIHEMKKMLPPLLYREMKCTYFKVILGQVKYFRIFSMKLL